MNVKLIFVKKIFLFCFFLIGSINLLAQTLIISDDFENGFASFWGSITSSVSISSTLAREDVYSARFRFVGVPEGQDSFAEARFDLGDYYEELSIKFDLYIPDNYEHRASNAGLG